MSCEATEGAIILGAGAGRRLQRGPKAFVELGGRSFTQYVASALSAAHIPRVALVLQAAAAEQPGLAGLAIVINPQPEQGPLSSVLLGLEALDRRELVERVVVHPVDHPLVTSEVIRQLLEVGRGVGVGVSRVVPSWQGRRGHPVLVCEAGLQALRRVTDPAATTLREVLHGAGETVDVAVGEPTVLQNLNTEEALVAARGVAEGEP